MRTGLILKSLKIPLLLIVLQTVCHTENAMAQTHFTNPDSVHAKNKYIIGFLPSRAKNLYGIAIGPIGSECICHLPYTRNSHGLNIQIGQGIYQTFWIGRWHLDSNDSDIDSSHTAYRVQNNEAPLKKVVHNGILLSVFGTFSDQVNGISSSLWMSTNRTVNGLSVNLLWNIQQKINGAVIGLVNTTLKTNGVQIGVYNRSVRLKGFQFGIWNVNEKRSLPLINWNFKASQGMD